MEYSSHISEKNQENNSVHLHIKIGHDHHILELNNSTASFILPSNNTFRRGIFLENKTSFLFQADKGCSQRKDFTQTGNIRKCKYEFSTLFIRTSKINRKQTLMIKSTYNFNQVETIITLGDMNQKRRMFDIVKNIRDDISKAFVVIAIDNN